VRRTAVLLLPAALAACKVEPTPRSFYNHRDPAVVELQESEGEIRTRVMGFVAALNRGDTTAALEAMNPAELVQVMGPAAEDSLARMGPVGLRAALAGVRHPGDGVARTPNLRVSATQTTGWFATYVEILPLSAEAGPAERLRLSGVFSRERGEWRLVQVHLSQPPLPPAVPDSAVTDSAAPPPNPDAAPEGDG
jgi:hypothetical protein